MPETKETFELKYEPEKVRETLRAHAERRGVKIGIAYIPHGTRIGNYKRQADKRSK